MCMRFSVINTVLVDVVPAAVYNNIVNNNSESITIQLCDGESKVEITYNASKNIEDVVSCLFSCHS